MSCNFFLALSELMLLLMLMLTLVVGTGSVACLLYVYVYNPHIFTLNTHRELTKVKFSLHFGMCCAAAFNDFKRFFCCRSYCCVLTQAKQP